MEDENIQDQAKDKAGKLGSYASRHPRRMWTGAFLMGMGAGMMAAKNKKKSGFQKFIDQFGD